MAFFYKPVAGVVGTGNSAMVPDRTKLGVACGSLIVLFVLALIMENDHAKAADALYNAFQILFTGTVALFGIESAKDG